MSMIYGTYFNFKRSILSILVVTAILFSSYPVNAEAGEMCFDGEPTVVEISGTFYEKTFPGPPEYESIEKGDRPETQWILKLDAPICAAITSQEESWIKWIIRDIKEIMLVLSQSMYKKHESLMGKKVIVAGTLWLGHTGHHRTPVLIMVKEIYQEKEEDKACLKWGQDEGNIAGTLISIGEAPNTNWKLILSKPICVRGKRRGDIEPSEDNVRELQIILYKDRYSKYEHLLSKQVVITGTPYPAHAPHHTSKVLLEDIRYIKSIYEACFKWHPEVENIIGLLVNIGEKPNTYWKLILPKPICVSGKVGGEVDFSDDDINDLHLILYQDQYPKYEHLLSKRVLVTGILYPAHMPHHISKVLLEDIRGMRIIYNKK